MRHRIRAARASGYSLIEVMIALMVLAFGLLTLATMQIHALKHGSAGRHTGDASAVGRTYLEQMARVDWAVLTQARDMGPDTTLFWADAADHVDNVVQGPGGLVATEATYDVRWTVTDVTACLRDIEVRVLWDEEGVPGQKNLRLATRRYNWGAAGC